MKVAVITPYYQEPDDWLRQCHQSVVQQSYPCSQFFVSDGHPNKVVDDFTAQHIRLPRPHGNYGDTPRAIGSLSAIGQGFDAIAYLDADNWYRKGHIESLVTLHRETGAAVCSSGRTFHRADGSLLGVCPVSDGERMVDTSCFFLTGPALRLVAEWGLIPADLHALGDRVIWHLCKRQNLVRAHSWKATLCYRGSSAFEYGLFGETPPPEHQKERNDVKPGIAALIARGGPDLNWRATPEQMAEVRRRTTIDPD